jgi:predicted  nucleic acid-binding Zn-ribbon protein
LSPLSGADLEALLAVQEVDTDLDRGRHRLATLPERAALAAVATQLAALDKRLAAAEAERDTVAERQGALEHTLAGVESRAAEVKKRLYGGTVSATRELQAMAAELDSLTARASDLESRVLETMEEREPLDRAVSTIDGEKASLVAAQGELGELLLVREGEVSAELDALSDIRAGSAAALPPDLLSTYDQLRARLGGVGAARLVGARCGGCLLTLPATDLDHLRHQAPGTLIHCDQCGRILVPARA